MALDLVPGTTGLYIGGLISLRRSAALKSANITHVVSALRGALDDDLLAPYKHLVIEVDDVEDEDIVQYFPKCNAFIADGLRSGGGVLVHCAMGKSRSATLVIAYLLSLAPQTTTPSSALEVLRTVRAIVEPNPGFAHQLSLYHSMGCPEDIGSQPLYQRWLYQHEVETSIACGRAPDTIRFEDEASATDGRAPKTSGSIVKCRKCRKVLATDAYIHAVHAPKPSSATQAARLAAESGPIASLTPSPSTSSVAQPQCAHLFLDPLSWMRAELEQGKLEGRLECPGSEGTKGGKRCGANVGKYAWQGMRCSCGEWVNPGFSLQRARVDVIRKNVADGRDGMTRGRGGGMVEGKM